MNYPSMMRAAVIVLGGYKLRDFSVELTVI
jgi:hypothetical protein